MGTIKLGSLLNYSKNLITAKLKSLLFSMFSWISQIHSKYPRWQLLFQGYYWLSTELWFYVERNLLHPTPNQSPTWKIREQQSILVTETLHSRTVWPQRAPLIQQCTRLSSSECTKGMQSFKKSWPTPRPTYLRLQTVREMQST